ncbi:MAG TPA: mechanosensitive ion channel family protein [Propionicimonas sp.]|jgi:small conductance mechanosensitive channel|uniref:mechanosensitive ion channel family protein n=1 Tax=Propionicimonas sp. TaxID=1955623 RepID=UPI002F415627
MTPLALQWSWPETPIAIGIILVVALVCRWLIVRAINLGMKTALHRAEQQRKHPESRAQRIMAMAVGADNERYEQRISTVASLLRNLTSIIVGVILVLTVMSVFDIPLAPLLASAGVGGIALAFGAQSLVKDFLSGIFMIMEDQYGVGDLIDTGEVRGTVEDVGLRVTRVRDATGTVWYVRNGEILKVGNQSQGWSTAIIDVPVAYDEDAGKVMAILEEVSTLIDDDPAFADVLLEKPTVAGVNAVTATTMSIRMMAKTAPNQHWGLQRVLLERSLTALAKAGVRSPSVNMGVLPT